MKSTTVHILTGLFVSFFSILVRMFQSLSLWYSESVLASCFMSVFGNNNSNFQKSKARSITAGCLEMAEWKYSDCSKRLGHEISPSVVSSTPARLVREEGDFVAHICGFPSQIAIDLQSKPARLSRHRETSINLVGGRRKHLVSFYQTVQV